MRELLLPGWVEFIIWIIIAGGFALFEAFTPSFFLIWFAAGAVAAAFVALAGFNEILQIVVFTIFSAGFIAFARPIVRKYILKDKDYVQSNVYTIIGAKAIVLKQVNQINGKIKIMNTGETWSAYTYERYDPIEENTQVIIKDVDGAKVVVVPRKAAKAENLDVE
jgi:membrane protein implicated in regulation of membrane protease activity